MTVLRARFRAVTAILAGLLLVALTGVTVVDVVGRYLMNAPLPGGKELTELLVMAVVFAGLPAICLDDGHVTADLFVSRMGPRGQAVQLFVARIAVVAALSLAAWQLYLRGVSLAGSGQTTMYLQISLAPVAWAAAAICAASALMTLGMAVMRTPRGAG